MDFPKTDHLVAVDSEVRLVKTAIISVDPLRIKNNAPALLSASCLVEPRVGDMVICALAGDGHAYILSIVERLEPNKESVLHFSAPLEIITPSLSIKSIEMAVFSEKVECHIGKLKRVVDSVEDFVENCLVSFGTFFMLAKRSIKRVEELDETRAGHLKLESPTLLEMNGAVTAISGEELIKMQSKQIHMG
ncbi:DUF3540 domain-containing protein [Polynucleobacter sp. IMCC30063]|uniref:DUF3540 domain-containing protein n=1 Tax=Polynucleobacter sp. IMCC30063 TaxID=2907298 RepID=UPI001F24D9C1|nr:DUF3540 domain-containing protein [Polynucleobacter sp. IMCC30063]MCE7505974.1 DUF3540 domain-containing protein [Polynucleobacter sp. IMCC30063]